MPSDCAAGKLSPAAHKALAQPFEYPAGSPYVEDSHRICAAPLAIAAVQSFYLGHVPRGATEDGTGSESSGELGVAYRWAGTKVLPDREVEVSLYPLGSDRTAIRRDGTVLYSPAKPAGEVIASQVSAVVVAVTPEHGHTVDRTVVAPAEVRKLVNLANGCERSDITSNPGGIAITATTAREAIVLHFFGGRASSRHLLATVDEHPLLGEGTGDVAVTVSGHRYPVLEDLTGQLAREGSRLTGVKVVL